MSKAKVIKRGNTGIDNNNQTTEGNTMEKEMSYADLKKQIEDLEAKKRALKAMAEGQKGNALKKAIGSAQAALTGFAPPESIKRAIENVLLDKGRVASMDNVSEAVDSVIALCGKVEFTDRLQKDFTIGEKTMSILIREKIKRTRKTEDTEE